MPKSTDARQRMVRTAARLLRRQGYCATGWRQVVAESGAPWGSQAHYFPQGKEQLAAEAIELAGARYEGLLRAGLSAAHPADFIESWVALAAAELEDSGWANGCPVATVTLETAHASERIANACEVALCSWRELIREALIAYDLAENDAESLATLILSTIEGALLLARAERDAEPLRTVGHELGRIVRARLA
jgi:TetR/AcrR family transcriptional repressor of lmrAB and yxaGH operons